MPKISMTLHTTASRCAENNERVATYAQNFADAVPASRRTGRPTATVSLLNKNKGERAATPREKNTWPVAAKKAWGLGSVG